MQFRPRKREHQEREMPATTQSAVTFGTEVDGCPRAGRVNKGKKQ
jgi:hypothetical protein